MTDADRNEILQGLKAILEPKLKELRDRMDAIEAKIADLTPSKP